MEFIDPARTCVIVGTGPSAGTARLECSRGWPCIAVNDAWRLIPWAQYLYACDRQWWNKHGATVRAEFLGECWTQDAGSAKAYGIRHVTGVNFPGLSESRGTIHTNAHSGAQAVNLATLWGAKRLLLVGFDLQPVEGRRHYFGDHPPGLLNNSPYAVFVRRWVAIAADLKRMGVSVINCSPVSALRHFPHQLIEDALCAAG